MHFKFQPAPRSGKVVAKAEDVRKAYGENLVLRGVDLEIERGDREWPLSVRTDKESLRW